MNKINKILITNTLVVPSYFNAGHHLPIFQVAQYLRKNNCDVITECKDIGVLNYTWKDFSTLIYMGIYDLICIMIDFDTADNIDRMVSYINSLSSKSMILLFGRMCKANPILFKLLKVNAIVSSGDYETSVNSYVLYCNGKVSQPEGCIYKENDKWIKASNYSFLNPNDWVFPNLSEIPFDYYSQLYANDTNKFCGIPNKKEFVINVSRGCPVNCSFCDVPKMQGGIDRRISPIVLYNYILDNFYKYDFDYVSMYSAIFTINKMWLRDFTELMENQNIPWKCVTTIEHLTEEDINMMAKAKCIRISIGVETLTQSNRILPSIKSNTKIKIKQIVDMCKKKHIEVNCFVMIGIPNTSFDEIISTITFLEELGVRIRPTVYTRYELLEYENDFHEIFKYNRQILNQGDFDSTQTKELYSIIHGKRLKNTKL